ncbi:MAG: M48 family metallopeptidase [Candidatus Marinimicrobia bacterium]|nr:M48 family metallopeptidase [Candidatus Neomarinimicrobiota bacterium]
MFTKYKKVNYNGIGIVNYIPTNRAKRINIRVKLFKGVIVKVPVLASFRKAEKFVLSKKNWIIKQQKKIKKQEILSMEQHKQNPITTDKIKTKIIDRTFELANRHKLKFNKLTIRNQRTRWGTCSTKNNISLNIKLVHLPNHLIDYVILHELTHIIEKNHSSKFWNKLSEYIDNPKLVSKELKKFPIV